MLWPPVSFHEGHECSPWHSDALHRGHPSLEMGPIPCHHGSSPQAWAYYCPYGGAHNGWVVEMGSHMGQACSGHVSLAPYLHNVYITISPTPKSPLFGMATPSSMPLVVHLLVIIPCVAALEHHVFSTAGQNRGKSEGIRTGLSFGWSFGFTHK